MSESMRVDDGRLGRQSQDYHDTFDTLRRVALDYGAALSAICIETIAQVATSPDWGQGEMP